MPALKTWATTPENSIALDVVANLFDALNQRGVRYCHWKSNLRLENSLRGQTDLDLLVDRQQSQILRQVLDEHNVKPILAPPGKRYPAIEDYLGFDLTSGKSFHLHVHYQLVLGEQFVKNYRLPLESYMLDFVERRHGVNIPIPELELSILVIRALLKYRDRDAIRDILGIRALSLPPYIVNEITWLFSQTTRDRLSEVSADLSEVRPADVVLEFVDTVVNSHQVGAALYRLRRRVRKALEPYQRDSRFRARLTYFQEAWRRRKRFKFSKSPKMTLPTGGVTLALVGADGAGKSTMCQKLAEWLSWKMDVHVYYLGSKQPSRRSELAYLLFRMARRSHRTICRVLNEQNSVARLMAAVRQSLLYAHYVFIAQDRYRRYVAGKKRAMNGSIVIFDRYPLDALTSVLDHHLLDGPQIRLAANGDAGWIARTFGRAEQNLYLKMRPPDYTFVLEVSPDISLQRKPDHDRAAIEAKSQTIDELIHVTKTGAARFNLIAIDADRPMDDVIGQLKTKVWEVL